MRARNTFVYFILIGIFLLVAGCDTADIVQLSDVIADDVGVSVLVINEHSDPLEGISIWSSSTINIVNTDDSGRAILVFPASATELDSVIIRAEAGYAELQLPIFPPLEECPEVIFKIVSVVAADSIGVSVLVVGQYGDPLEGISIWSNGTFDIVNTGGDGWAVLNFPASANELDSIIFHAESGLVEEQCVVFPPLENNDIIVFTIISEVVDEFFSAPVMVIDNNNVALDSIRVWWEGGHNIVMTDINGAAELSFHNRVNERQEVVIIASGIFEGELTRCYNIVTPPVIEDSLIVIQFGIEPIDDLITVSIMVVDEDYNRLEDINIYASGATWVAYTDQYGMATLKFHERVNERQEIVINASGRLNGIWNTWEHVVAPPLVQDSLIVFQIL
jgi:hypothetical protein